MKQTTKRKGKREKAQLQILASLHKPACIFSHFMYAREPLRVSSNVVILQAREGTGLIAWDAFIVIGSWSFIYGA